MAFKILQESTSHKTALKFQWADLWLVEILVEGKNMHCTGFPADWIRKVPCAKKKFFCFGILLPKVFWPTVICEKKCSSVWEKAFEIRGWKQSIQTVKGQNNIWWQNAFLIFLGGFSSYQ